MPRELTYAAQEGLVQDAAWYVNADGSLDVDKLLAAFQTFFREHSEHWIGRFDYAEAGPQLLLQAFLQRIVNGGGRIEREYGLGRGRTDLLIIWPTPSREDPHAAGRFVIECKVLRKSLEQTVRQGLEQTAGYMDRCAAGRPATWSSSTAPNESAGRTGYSAAKNALTAAAPTPSGECDPARPIA